MDEKLISGVGLALLIEAKWCFLKKMGGKEKKKPQEVTTCFLKKLGVLSRSLSFSLAVLVPCFKLDAAFSSCLSKNVAVTFDFVAHMDQGFLEKFI